MSLADFRHVTRFRVPFHDIDMMQHVNHAAYVVWAETARVGYFMDVVGVSLSGRDGLILARLEFDYKRPLDLGEPVAIGCRISRLGRKSLDFTCEVWSEAAAQRAAIGLTTLVAYDYQIKKSQPIPEPWRQAILAYESVAPMIESGAASPA